MTKVSTLLTISVLIEQDREVVPPVPDSESANLEVESELMAAVAALASRWPDVNIEWSSSSYVLLDVASGYGRCAVCNRWVYDAELKDGEKRYGVSVGAIVDGRYRCDEHLPTGHPMCFCGIGYDGPIPE